MKNKMMRNFGIAGVLVLLGLLMIIVSLMVSGWNFDSLSTTPYETNTYQIDEAFHSVSIELDTADVRLVSSTDETCTVTCAGEVTVPFTVSVESGVLSIRSEDQRSWYDHIGIHFEESYVTLTLPQEQYEELHVQTSTGDITVSELSTAHLTLGVSTGKILVSDTSCTEMLQIQSSTGTVKLENISCGSLIAHGRTGDLTMEQLLANDEIRITYSTGDIHFENCDAETITVKTSTGDVTGTLLSDKTFITETDTGRVSIPAGTEGGICEITTSTGDIWIGA